MYVHNINRLSTLYYFTNAGAADNTISYRLKITGRNCLDWKPGLVTGKN